MFTVRRAAACLGLAAATLAQAQTRDVPTWYASQLPADQFVAVHAESWSGGRWHSRGAGFQPFRSFHNEDGRQLYWRKDHPKLEESWYGEIYHYDERYVYLHSETFPVLHWESPGAWDERPSRFRLFRNAADPRKGRVIAPRTITAAWVHQQLVNTDMCGMSTVTPGYARTDGFRDANAGACPRYQSGVEDVQVTATLVDRFDLLAAGPAASDAPTRPPVGAVDIGPLPRVFDKALVISQVMAAGDAFARERFILGWHQGRHYGMIAWDNAVGPAIDRLQVIERTIGLRVMAVAGGDMRMDGMLERGARDRTLPPPGRPAQLVASCVADSDHLRLSWTGVPGQTGTDIRIDDRSDLWNPGGGNDLVVDHFPGNSYTFRTRAGRRYEWWVHASNESGDSAATGAGSPAGACTGTATSLPAQPAGLRAQTNGDVALLLWDDVHGAETYDVRIDDLGDPWMPGKGYDVVVNGHPSNSYLFRMLPGHVYRWWVHARNALGESRPTMGAAFGL